MSDVKERLDKLRDLVQNRDFLEGKGLQTVPPVLPEKLEIFKRFA